jgi:hypothetical protein
MIVTGFSNLNELKFPPEVIDYLLVALNVPPLDREVVFAAGGHNPKRDVFPGNLVYL